MPDARRDHRRKRRQFGSWSSVAACRISEKVLLPTECSLRLFTTCAAAGRMLLPLCAKIPQVLRHSPSPPLAPRRTLHGSRDSYTEDPSRPEFFREGRWGSERQRHAWIDGRMKACAVPMRHPGLWCYWEMCSLHVCVCARASEILLASLWLSPPSLSCTGLCMEK